MNQRTLIVLPDRKPADMQKVAPGMHVVSVQSTYTQTLRGYRWQTVILVNLTENEFRDGNPELYEVVFHGMEMDRSRFVVV